MNTLFNAKRQDFERLSPEDYLARRKDQPSSLKRARIVPPSLDDDDDYGSFIIESSVPRYEVDRGYF